MQENKRKIVLASQSPRRKQLLEQMGLQDFEIKESCYEENMQAMDDPRELVRFLALGKAKKVAQHYADAIIIGGDTFIVFNGQFIGKPKDKNDAKQILKNFSGKEHLIISGLALIDTRNEQTITDFGQAKIKFRKLSNEEINNYVNLEESLEMAGAYGLMNRAAPLIESINGDFYSVVGLPLNKLYLGLKKMGVDLYKR
ncbi:MAG TPA: septum formation protein Maf [Candidatus Portnoybacteria bacterium]|nr:septum formation protein Maf [Candidatus Portnoybacteria bacterium]